MMKMLAESSFEILSFETSLMLVSPIALICSLMFLAGILTAEKYTPAGFLALFFRPKLLTKKGRHYSIGFWISALPLIILLAFPAFRILDLPILGIRHVTQSDSPDASRSLVISEWTRFPLTEFVDPSISIRFSLIDRKSNAVLTERIVHVRELSDLGMPVIAWEKDLVKIRGFDSGKQDRIVTISLDP